MVFKTLAEKALKKMGLTDEQIAAGFADTNYDIEDKVANERLSSIYTADEAKGSPIFDDVKKTTKAEALNAIDQQLKVAENEFTPEQKTAFAALGNNTFEKLKFATGVISELKKSAGRTGDPNYDDLKKQFDALNNDLTAKYVKKEDYETLNSQLAKTQRTVFDSKVITGAMNLVKDASKKSSKHFQSNFINDFEEFLSNGVGTEKVKGVIDPATGNIVRADDPTRPLMIGTEVANVEKLLPLVVEYGKYNEGYTPPPSDVIKIPGAGANPEEKKLSLAGQRNLESLAK